MGRGGPMITHLLFADDLILFRATSVRNAHSFFKCPDKYSKWLGQRFNQNKSFIHFSTKTPPPSLRDIRAILGFRSHTRNPKYLGLPLNLDRNNMSFFFK